MPTETKVETPFAASGGQPVVSVPPATSEREPAPRYPVEEPSSAAVGWIMFAGIMMIVSGGFSILQGLAWLINSERFLGEDTLFSQNAETWGWVTLILGSVVLLAGFGVFTGNLLARIIGVTAAVLSMFGAFLALTFYPVWGVCVIAVDIAVIWALTAHGRDLRKIEQMRAYGG